MITRRAAALVSCGCARSPAVVPSSMKERALRKMSRRAFMVRLLGKIGSSDDGRAQARTVAGWIPLERPSRFTRVRAGYGRACRGVKYIIVLFLMQFGDKQDGPEAP